jgi:DNA-binding NarL/FixJ family response regulator
MISFSDKGESIAILVVDDHPAVLFGLQQLLEKEPGFEVVGAACSCKELCSKAAHLSPDVVVMDLEMDDSSGAEAVARLRKQHYDGHIVVYSAHDERDLVLKLLDFNVRGYVTKASSREYVWEAIRAVVDGRLYFDPTIAPLIMGTRLGRNEPVGQSGTD